MRSGRDRAICSSPAGQGVEHAPQDLDETPRIGDVRLATGELEHPADDFAAHAGQA